ncbi:MAG: MarR family transcriptional regulator [Proteobacteria bacterium]|nr:MarR family transcriptional regulator [Pseudomonadota bacterium]
MTSDSNTENPGDDAAADNAGYGDLWARPGFLIRRLHQLHVSIFIEECKAFDVTPVQYAVLSVLYRGTALDQVSVAAEVGIDRNNAADVLRRLDRRGFVERVASDRDRRAKLNRITDAGRRFVEDAHEAMEAAQDRFTGALSARDRARLMELLQRVMMDINDAGRAPLNTGDGHG